MFQNGHISNCPIQVDDLDRATHIHSKDVGLLKGETTRKKPLPVIESIVPVPKEMLNLHKNVFLTVDLFFVNKIVLLVTYSRRICLTTDKWLDTRKITGVLAALREVFNAIEGLFLLFRRSMGITYSPHYNLALTRCWSHQS
jgi:hypothetical protein